MSGGGSQTVYQKLDPKQAPFVEYGLEEAQRLYEGGMPSYFPDQTYVSPSEQTEMALSAAQNRAATGNPLVPAAQQQFLNTIQGDYTSATNPYFANRFATASDAATQKYFDAVNQINSQASMAGRYGSGAQNDLIDRATGQLSKSLSDTAGALAFDNYNQERARQLQTAQAAPAMAATDYADIDKMLQLGQIGEGYSEMALRDSINRFNFQQALPGAQLQQYLSAAYGAPMGTVTTQPVGRGGLAGALGGAAMGGSIAQAFGMTNPYTAGLVGLGALSGII
jgi:hypothetical protein